MPARLARSAQVRRCVSTSPASRAASALATTLAVLAATSSARAEDACRASPLVSSCINADNLWPHPGPQVFATVGGVETVAEGKFGFGLVTDYLSRPIVFHTPGPGAGGTDQYAVDNQVNGTFMWAVGITRRLELDLAVPVTFGQNGSGAGPVTGATTALHTTAMRDIRFGVASQLLPRVGPDRDRAFGLTARVEVSAPNGDRDQFAGDATAVFAPSLAADYRAGRVFAGLEIGARIRPDAQAQGANVGPQGVVALGVGYDLLQRAKLLSALIEARSLPTFATQFTPVQTTAGTVEVSSGRTLAPSEWMLGLRSSPLATDDVSVTLGGGGALTGGEAGFTTPRFRFLLGLRYAPTESPPLAANTSAAASASPAPTAPAPLVLGLGATPDRCKEDPDSADGFKDDDGCPDEDADKDGIDDRYDRCPLQAEDFFGPPDGCPDPPPPARPDPKKP
jgi:hypothetical protein